MRPAHFLLLIVWAAAAPATAEPYEVGSVAYDRSERFLLPSEAVGDVFRIDVILPIGYDESEDAYPVVLVTDSDYLLASAAATQLAQATDHLPKLILVGIGYDVPSIADTAQVRVRDFTPTCDKGFVERNAHPKELCGKADNFVAFIRNELKPLIKSRYRASDDTTLVGYSFGGVFALHALLSRVDVADRYVIGSASIEWDGEVLFDQESRYASAHDDLAAIVYLSAGGLEGNATIPNAYLMYEQLRERSYPGLTIGLEVLDGETHMTAISSTVMRGLRWVFAAQDIADEGDT